MGVFEKLDQLANTHPVLAAIFQAEWETPLSHYARQLYPDYSAQLEPELIAAFRDELKDMNLELSVIDAAIGQLERKPVIQTSHHITPTHGPTFLAIDLISLAGLQKDEVYLIGANSGVAFSNSAWSGAISYGSLGLKELLKPDTKVYHSAVKSARERNAHGEDDFRISFIPSKSRDQLVFSAYQQDYLTTFRLNTSDSLRQFLPETDLSKPYSFWAAETCAKIQRFVLNHERIIVCDINRVITRYLITVLKNRPDHPCSRLLLGREKTIFDILDGFKHPPIFLGSYKGKKSAKVDPIHKTTNGFESRKSGVLVQDRKELIRQLETFQWSPGVFVLFLILRFLNDIKCLGSFNQAEYLETQRKVWERYSTGWDLFLSETTDAALTTGRLMDETGPVWPVDLALRGQRLRLRDFLDKPMSFFWEPILKQLVNGK